jgi:hypothetical protein
MAFLALLERATVVTSRAEEYWQLARDCRSEPPPGPERSALLEMAEVWDRLADQQEHATDLRKKE